TIERVSVAAGGTQANNHSDSPSLSADGRFVAFESEASNLVKNDLNNFSDIFITANPFADFRQVQLNLVPGDEITDLNFGLVPDPGTISGRVYEDTVANGVFDIGEPVVANALVFLDLDGDRVLDDGERSVNTASDGTYQFLNTNSFRSYSIVTRIPVGFEQIAPTASDRFTWNIFLPAGGNVTDRDFAIRRVQSTGQSSASAVSGRLFDDRNGNKIYDAGDVPISNREVYLDATNFGVRDPNEPRVLTDSQGMYSMEALSSQTVSVTTTLNSTLLHVSPLGSNFNKQTYPLFNSIQAFKNPQAIASGDFNQDGFLDVAVALGEGNKISIRLNNGQGGFLPNEINIDLGTNGAGPTSIVVGQFDSDSKLDVAITANLSSNVIVLLNFNPVSNVFASQSSVAVGLQPIDIAAGQFAGDSKLDLVVVNKGSTTVASTVQLLTNNGSGLFTTSAAVATGGKDSVSLVAGNFTGDASLDIAVIHASPINTSTAFGGVTVLRGNGAGSLTLQPNYYTIGGLPIDSITSDFNADGRADLAVANFSTNSISILLGQADGTFRVQTAILGTASGAFDIAVGDMDNDGDMDLIASNLNDRSLSIFRNIGVDTSTGDVRFQPLENVGLAQFTLAQRMPLVVANFDNDTSGPGGTGTIDIVTIPQLTDTLYVLKNTLVNGTHRVELTGLNRAVGLDFIIKSAILPPTLNAIANPAAILEDAGQQTISLSGIARGRAGTTPLSFIATSSQPSIIPNPTVQYTDLSTTGALHFTPVANASGTSVITVTVTDPGADGSIGTSADNGVISRSFTVTITPANDPPSFLIPTSQLFLNEDAGSLSYANFVTGITNGGGSFELSQTRLPFVVTTFTPALFQTLPTIDATGRLTFVPALNASGSSSLKVSLQDNGGTANGGSDTYFDYFFVVISAVNDAPSISIGANQSARVGSGAKSVTGFAFGFQPGGGSDEAAQTITDFVVTNDNSAIFASQPTIDTSGVLRYTPSSTTSGTANVNVRVRDNGGTQSGGTDLSTVKTFTIAITSFTAVADRKLFYHRSTSTVFGNGSGNPTNAIDTTKTALLPGQTASFSNYTNYVRGLNGILVDLSGTLGTIGVSDFQFAMWNGMNSTGFVSTSAVPTISVIPGGGTSGATRVKIEFADNAIRNTWLRVTVLANANTNLANNDVFYFGNAIGDFNVGNTGTPIIVRSDESDRRLHRSPINQSPAINSVGITNVFDVNKDGRVNPLDISLVNQSQTRSSPGLLRFFTASTNLIIAPTIGLLESNVPFIGGLQVSQNLRRSVSLSTIENEPKKQFTSEILEMVAAIESVMAELGSDDQSTLSEPNTEAAAIEAIIDDLDSEFIDPLDEWHVI
ncbi:MAG: VCBS repeat-containing protein, partial [Pirellulaceae bacterium]|nr:VCBS repeat-containing protein [Pirellulaceae bacterium]